MFCTDTTPILQILYHSSRTCTSIKITKYTCTSLWILSIDTLVHVCYHKTSKSDRQRRRKSSGSFSLCRRDSDSHHGTPHGQAETSALLFYPQQFSARCTPAGLPVRGYRSSAKAPLRACSACCAKGGKLRDGSEGRAGKGTLFPGLRRSGAAEPVRLRRTSLCAFVSAFRSGRVLFPDAQGGGLRGGAGTCGGHSAQKPAAQGTHPAAGFLLVSMGFLQPFSGASV